MSDNPVLEIPKMTSNINGSSTSFNQTIPTMVGNMTPVSTVFPKMPKMSGTVITSSDKIDYETVKKAVEEQMKKIKYIEDITIDPDGAVTITRKKKKGQVTIND